MARGPEAVALTGAAAGEPTLSYGELNARANRLAHHLAGLGAGAEDLVGIALPRSCGMVVALLATLKAGAAYLPLDTDHPEARLAHMLADAAPVLVLTTRALRHRLPRAVGRRGRKRCARTRVPVVSLDAPVTRRAIGRAPAHDPTRAERVHAPRPGHAAYVIYTSGSTGRPKGVVVTHAGIPALAGAFAERLELEPASRVLQFASLNFDASLWEVVVALTTGAALVLLPQEARSGAPLREAMVGHRVTHALLPPTVLATLEEGGDLPLAGLVVGGRGVLRRAGRALLAVPAHGQCLRTDGDHGGGDVERAPVRPPGAAHRLAAAGPAGLRVGRRCAAGADRGDRRAPRRRCRPGAGLPEPSAADRATFFGRPVWGHPRGPDVPHRRPRPMAGRRRPGRRAGFPRPC